MATLNRPTLEELRDRIIGDLVARIEGAEALLRRSVLNAFAFVQAGVAHSLYGYLERLGLQAFPQTATGDHLAELAITYGVPRLDAVFAEGEATFTGESGSEIPIGARLRRSDGEEYQTVANLPIGGSGEGTVAIQATRARASGTVAPGQVLTLVSALPLVEPIALVFASTTQGADAETDEQLRARILQRLSAGARGGTAEDWATWTKEAPGVGRVFVFRAWAGPGTVGVTYIKDDGSLPDAIHILGVNLILEARSPLAAQFTIIEPSYVDVDFDVAITPDTPQVRANVEAELADLLDREGGPGTVIPESKVREAISSAAGEEDHILNSPLGALGFQQSQFPRLGVVTWGP